MYQWLRGRVYDSAADVGQQVVTILHAALQDATQADPPCTMHAWTDA